MGIFDFFKKKETPVADNSGTFVPPTVMSDNNVNPESSPATPGSDGGASGGDGGTV